MIPIIKPKFLSIFLNTFYLQLKRESKICPVGSFDSNLSILKDLPFEILKNMQFKSQIIAVVISIT